MGSGSAGPAHGRGSVGAAAKGVAGEALGHAAGGRPLTGAQVARYYEGYSNGVLWPLFHYLLDQIPLHVRDWDAYVEVNEQFAENVAQHYQAGDLIWVHDYQLLLLPQLLRRRLPDARVGFFLHIPFPSEELFRTLPDAIGSSGTARSRPGWLSHPGVPPALRRLAHADPGAHGGYRSGSAADRDVRLGVFPMGIDAESFRKMSEAPGVAAEALTLKDDGNLKLLVGVDRLDYTKGIPRRLLAYERMLEAHPDRGRE